MADLFELLPPSDVAARVIAGLRLIGYSGSLLEEDYSFPDWFSSQLQERRVTAAAFGQTPISYDSACIGVVTANGMKGETLVDRCRALGAPIVIEIDGNQIREWAVSRTQGQHGLVHTYSSDRIDEMLQSRAVEWRPQNMLRLKNVGSFQWHEQLGLFAGLVPDLEEQIQEKLDPLLRDTLSVVRGTYLKSAGREPNGEQIFKLIFGILTAKVFYDRRFGAFSRLTADADEILSAVAKHYREEMPRLLNRESRQVATERIWREFDFRNLSVEVLAQIWSNTLVDGEIKKKLSIHRTSRTIVRYIVERIPFTSLGDDKRLILEPCSGSAVFLVGAMNVLRPRLFAMDALERHKYFVNHLAGIEADPFAVEISKLALTLADFPNPNGWHIEQADIFDNPVSEGYLKRSAVVLCNPPYSDFEAHERKKYGVSYVQRPAAVLEHVLDSLHPEGVLGFVLPRIFADGRGAYSNIRKRLAKRFASIELTVLPDRAFADADSEIAVLIAKDPIPHRGCMVVNRKVNDSATAWMQFAEFHQVSSEYAAEMPISEAERSLIVPELPEVWDLLAACPTLGEMADIHRGIEWNLPLTKGGVETGNRARLISDRPMPEFRAGLPPQTTFNVFEVPRMAYLNFTPELQRGNPWKHPWGRPKAIVNKAARSRGNWRMASFPDTIGLACYQTFFGVWPKSSALDEWILSAILNSPVANAFVATREGKTDVTKETLSLIPIPILTEVQCDKIRYLIRSYQATIEGSMIVASDEAEAILKEIDATVLSGYRMTPRVERQVLDFFRGQRRPVVHAFSDYFPSDFSAYFSLAEYLSPDFSLATVGELLRRRGKPSQA